MEQAEVHAAVVLIHLLSSCMGLVILSFAVLSNTINNFSRHGQPFYKCKLSRGAILRHVLSSMSCIAIAICMCIWPA